MKNLRRMSAFLLVMVMVLSMAVTASAAGEDTGFSDVAANAWYAEAVQYCRNNSLMDGTSATTFSPNSTMTRAMLATVLYRYAGKPAAAGETGFTDTPAGAWYSSAVTWVSANGIMSGYGGGLFGPDDPVTREQIATILWRYEGRSTAFGIAVPYADQDSISSYAVSAVTWAKENGIINGTEENRFAPKNNVTRAQVAAILMNDLREDTSELDPPPAPGPSEESRVLVAYFSRTGTTEGMAELIARQTDGTLFEIVPATLYSENYQETVSRHQEERRTDARPEIAEQVEDMGQYDVIFIGFPLWSGDAPVIIRTFMESYDLSGKTVIPFATSGGSGISAAQATVTSFCPNSAVLDGLCISGGNMESRVTSWIKGLALAAERDAV